MRGVSVYYLRRRHAGFFQRRKLFKRLGASLTLACLRLSFFFPDGSGLYPYISFIGILHHKMYWELWLSQVTATAALQCMLVHNKGV